jgi:predicted tellurium resistance membrane protein TerC
MEALLDPHTWLALATLTALEIVLGVDNIIFISILAGRLPEHQRDLARRLGLAFAMLTRIGLLLSLAWIMTLTAPLFEIPVLGKPISGRDLILIGGGLFLIWKSVHEIHNALEGEEPQEDAAPAAVVATLGGVIVQIAIIDIVFSLDSVITAVGMVEQVWIMVTAIVIAIGVMMLAAKAIGEFVDRHPTIKMLALSFLILIGVALIGEGWDLHIPKGYIYFAMAFSVAVEMLNLRMRARRAAPLHLRRQLPRPEPGDDSRGVS